MNGENPRLLIHYRFDGVVPGERGFAVEGLAAHWATRVVTLCSVSVP